MKKLSLFLSFILCLVLCSLAFAQPQFGPSYGVAGGGSYSQLSAINGQAALHVQGSAFGLESIHGYFPVNYNNVNGYQVGGTLNGMVGGNAMSNANGTTSYATAGNGGQASNLTSSVSGQTFGQSQFIPYWGGGGGGQFYAANQSALSVSNTSAGGNNGPPFGPPHR